MLLRHPEVASRSCSDCKKWTYKSNGEVLRRPAHVGAPVPRSPGDPTPCWKCPKIPADEPIKLSTSAVELSAKNRKAYWHYQQCKAVGRFPDDPIVARNAAIIAGVLKQLDDLRLDRVFLLLGGKL